MTVVITDEHRNPMGLGTVGVTVEGQPFWLTFERHQPGLLPINAGHPFRGMMTYMDTAQVASAPRPAVVVEPRGNAPRSKKKLTGSMRLGLLHEPLPRTLRRGDWRVAGTRRYQWYEDRTVSPPQWETLRPWLEQLGEWAWQNLPTLAPEVPADLQARLGAQHRSAKTQLRRYQDAERSYLATLDEAMAAQDAVVEWYTQRGLEAPPLTLPA